MNLQELQAAAQAAGERYRAAYDDLISAYRLARAYEDASNNSAVVALSGGHVKTFPPQMLDHFALEHPVWTAGRFPRDLAAEIANTRDVILAQFEK